MTKISTYITDNLITGGDKWIGSDISNYNRTKNFTPDKLATYFNNNQIINIGSELQYTYYTIEPSEIRPRGTLTFETEIGAIVNFSSITTFLLSKYTTKNNDVSNFFNFIVGSKILLYKSLNVNSFGYYTVTSISPYTLDSNFYKVVVSYISGNGYIEEDNDYMISVVDKSTGGGGSTNLSTTQTASNFTINSDTGDDAVVPLGNGFLAGATLNNYTTAEQTKLSGIATGANVGVVPNSAITGSTNTKITYDSKGLVTSSSAATTVDISDTANKRYVTDANLTVINNTSNTNTGDQGLQSVTDLSAVTNKTITAAGFKTSTGTGANIFLDNGTTTPLKFQSNIVVSLTGTKTLGKYSSGQTIPSAGKTFEQVINDIAIEYLPPSINSFSISGQSTTVESGTVISGTKSFIFDLSESGNITPNTLGIYYGATALATGLAVSSPANVSVGTVNITGNGTSYSWSAKATNTQSTVFTSNTFSITSRYNQFYGNVTTTPTTSADVRALSNNNFANTNSWITPTISTTKFALSIPATKSLTSVITANFEDITSSFVLSTFNVNDAGGNPISYKTYTYSSTIPLNLKITITVA